METLVIYNIVNAIFSCIAFLSNLGSLIYIIKSFDIKQSFFYILCLDAVVVMTSAFISLIMFSIAISGETLGEMSCSFLFVGSQITVLTSPMCNFMVSFIRYGKSTLCPFLARKFKYLISYSLNFFFVRSFNS